MNFNDDAIKFIVETDWENLPPKVRHQSKRCLLDTLGALIGGTRTPVAKIMTALSMAQYRGHEATILVIGRKCSAAGAALANGFAGNALDIDDGYRLVKGHPGACILPVILAAGEMSPTCSGKQFLAALTIGYEIGIRAGLIRHACYETFHSSGSWGAVAGAAAAGKIMGLGEAALRNAMGTAECHAPIAPMMKGIETPAMTKDAIGWGTMVAMISVGLAQKGFTGIEPMFNDTPRPDWIENLGETYEILNLYFKPYAACRWAQPAISGALKIMKHHDMTVDDIARIDVRTFKEAVLLSRAHPENTEQAQYNLAFPVAAAIIDGELRPNQILPPRIFDSEILKLADKVHTAVSEAFDQLFPEKTQAEVVIRTKRGDSFSSGAMEAEWEPPNGLPSDGEIEEKFHHLVAPILGPKQTHQLCSLIWHFEKCSHVNKLIELCVKT